MTGRAQNFGFVSVFESKQARRVAVPAKVIRAMDGGLFSQMNRVSLLVSRFPSYLLLVMLIQTNFQSMTNEVGGIGLSRIQCLRMSHALVLVRAIEAV